MFGRKKHPSGLAEGIEPYGKKEEVFDEETTHKGELNKKSFGSKLKETVSGLGQTYKDYKAKAPEREKRKQETLRTRLQTEKLKTQIGEQKNKRATQRIQMGTQRNKMLQQRQKSMGSMPSMFGGTGGKQQPSISFDEAMNPNKYQTKKKKGKTNLRFTL